MQEPCKNGYTKEDFKARDEKVKANILVTSESRWWGAGSTFSDGSSDTIIREENINEKGFGIILDSTMLDRIMLVKLRENC